MPFDKVETQVDFPALERDVLELWDRIGAFDQLRQKNKVGPRWSFLDGPITANNPMGVHHAWGRTYKDAYQRFHAMLGQCQRYQNGFDCQGLWVEVEVEKEFKLGSKKDIECLVPGDRFASIDQFVRECKARVDRFARVQTEQSIRLGYWMDWDRTDEDWSKPPGQRKSYFTMSEENNYTIWSFLKKCHQRGLVYRGFDAMPWCPRCGVGLSEMEVKEGYRLVEHRAVFVKFPLRDRPGESLLVWTTTPWTLTSNVAAAVNPELTYLKVKLKDEIYYLARGAFTADRMAGATEAGGDDEDESTETEARGRADWLPGVPHLKRLEQLFKEKGGKDGYAAFGEVKGAEMVGWAYEGPFDDLPATGHEHGYPDELAHVVEAQKWAPAVSTRAAHRVVAWKDVGEKEGTGIVHIAPGCGKEDFLLGKEQGLPPVAPLDEAGVFLKGFGGLTGLSAVSSEVPDLVFADLQKKGRLFATERYVHRYPHCWRCKTELLFRLVDEWFINMGQKPDPRRGVPPGGYRAEILKVVDQVTFLPESINGQAKERNWLENMGDWMISKKRFWGLALPIWVDEKTNDFEVIGSYPELKARAVEGWDRFEGHSPHRPWVDVVKIRNPKTGNLMSRIPDVGNPWLDAGIVPYSTMGYNRDRAYWEKWFPADFITESFPGQFRNWFYAILAMSTMMENRPPFKVLFGYALMRDQNGQVMSKSKGNSIEFNGAADSGYELFTERKPSMTPQAQAKKDLPAGYIEGSVYEDEILLEAKLVKVVKGKYPPIGADVLRWLFCRQNPAVNLNMGPGPANDVRARFVLKLWNVYAFFSNYARLDDFDPNAPAVPVARRADLDRWILSDLQKLVALARKSLEGYDVMSFSLEAERFVDDRLSNWYVRRNRGRFQKGEKDEDKQAAHQTLYTVLVTLTKLFAPVVPFLTETMYQNLVVRGAGKGPASVHLCDYPEVDKALIDERLSADVAALQRLVTLGSAARNAVKIKVRQPLMEMKVQPADEADRRAVERFGDQIRDELNVKKVTLHDPAAGPLLRADVKPNMRTWGPKFGRHLQDVQAAFAAMDPAEVARWVQEGKSFRLCEFELGPADVVVTYAAAEGWVGVADRGTEVTIDARITPALAREGMAREVVRQVQDLRKQSRLEMEDRIVLFLATEDESLRQAIDEHRAYIAEETLTVEWATAPLNGEAGRTRGKVDGKELTIALVRAGA
jgi:isoleucyl-tRNA synthetase